MEVHSLINLVCLNISNNRLSGEIPRLSVGACPHLKYLHLEGNFFQENIPQSFISLKGIKELDQIPKFLDSFRTRS